MAGFFSKLFGMGKGNGAGSPEEALQKTLDGVIDNGGFSLSFEIEATDGGYLVNFSGDDAKLLTSKDGLLLDSFQVFLKRMLQHRFADKKIELLVDSQGFMESSAQELKDLADKLKTLVLDKGQPSYVRALSPRDRKIVHRHLAEDGRVKSQSIGEGFCKKIKISLARPDTTAAKLGREAQSEL
jgi:spoIIIJ-associated protein